MQVLKVSALSEHFNLKNYTEKVDLEKAYIEEPDVNRLALQLTDFFDFFQETRVQLIGKVESAYLEEQDEERKRKVYEKLCSYKVPCIIFSRDIMPDESLLKIAASKSIPVLGTGRDTSTFLSDLIIYLKDMFAPSITVHGVLIDVDGEGVLITGESGIGKSEAALELIQKGHRLVADDAVVIRKIDDTTLVGSAPPLTKHFLEVRGIGIIDVQMIFGTKSVIDSQSIDLVIKLTDWNGAIEFDRVGLNDEYIEYLGTKVTCQTLPIRPRRNIANICEVAAVNHRQKKLGYNAARELYRRMQENAEEKE